MTKSGKLQILTMEELRIAAGLEPFSRITNPAQHGRVSHARGEFAEAMVLRAALGLTHQVPWLLGARRATREEDSEGKDVVLIDHKHREIYVQVKSSDSAARKFLNTIKKPESRRGHLYTCCIVLIVRPQHHIKRVQLELLQALVKLHWKTRGIEETPRNNTVRNVTTRLRELVSEIESLVAYLGQT